MPLDLPARRTVLILRRTGPVVQSRGGQRRKERS